MFLRNPAFPLIFLLIFVPAVFPEGTRTWEQSKYDDFLKGTPHGVAISSDGTLKLAPAFKLLAATPSSAVWATAVGPHGEIYAATGAPARIYQIVPGAPPVVIFQPQELQVQALVVDKNGVLYGATNPDGKVYKIEHAALKERSTAEETRPQSEWRSSVYFDPGTKYIWGLALDVMGTLYVATGDHGQIFRVAVNGEHSLFFKSDEPHIRVLTIAPNGDLIAGSDGSGLIYRISPQGEGFVLYSAPKKEITSLALDNTGNIYVAGTGEKRAGPPSAALPLAPLGPAPPPAGNDKPPGPAPESSPAPGSSPLGVPGGSEIYKIAPDGSPARLWSSHEDLVYALAFDQNGHLLAGSGNRGRIFLISGRDDYSELLKAAATQVTSFSKAPGGLYASTSNLGKIFLLNHSADAEGTYESDVLDARGFSKWGRCEFRGGGQVELFVRSGNVDNPDRNWSAWKKVDLQNDAGVPAPPARFIQWKAVLHSGSVAPRVDSITLNYLPKNVAPEFDDVLVTPGTRYQAAPRPPNLEPGQRVDPQPNPVRDRLLVGVKWTVRDQNDDQLVYAVYYRGDGQSRWLLLKSNLSEKFYAFDSSLLPDGGYTIKVIASDAPSHSPEDALTSEKESSRFEVDTTSPQIRELQAFIQGDKIHIQFRAVDTFSPIKRAEYSLDAGDWHLVEPVSQLSDSKSESYEFSLPVTAEGASQEHVIVVRAYDRYENMNSAKTLVPGK